MRARALVAASAAVLLLTACGGDDEGSGAAASSGAPSSSSEAGSSLSRLAGPEVAAAAADAVEEAGAVHVQGSGTSAGQTLEIDMHLQGEDSLGTLVMDGVTVQFMSVGGVAYLQAPVEFWVASGMPAEMTGMFDGVWVIVPPEASAEFDTFSLAALVEELRNPSDGAFVEDVESDELDGAPVVLASRENGSTLTVAAEGPTYPLFSDDKGAEPGTLTWSRFGERVEIAAPADALDLNELGA